MDTSLSPLQEPGVEPPGGPADAGTAASRAARSAIHGVTWRYLAFFGGKLMVFISTVILARLLSKEDFGIVGYAVTTISFLDVLSDLGIGPAVIYSRDDSGERNVSDTAFWLNLSIGMLLFTITWLGAPLAGDYFRDVRAVPVTRALALTFPIWAAGNIHEAQLKKRLAFERIFVSDFIQAAAKGLFSILFALLGLGAWSLIIGQLSANLTSVITLWSLNPWRPRLRFALQTSRELISYGLHIVSVDILGIFLLNLDYLLVGRYLGAEALGAYTLAFRVPDLLILQFARILSGVIFPIYTKMRDIPGSLAKGFTLTTRYVSLVTVPMGLGVALVARPFVLTVFTEKWIDMAPVMQAIALYAMLLSLAYNAGSVYKAEGRPQVLTYLGLIRLAMLLPALWWAVHSAQSIVAVGWMQMLAALFSGALNLAAAAYLIRLPLRSLLQALFPAALSGALMSAAVWGFLAAGATLPAWLQLILAALLGGGVYAASLWFLQRTVVLEALAALRDAGRLKKSQKGEK